ncbi:MAG TPA: M28 family peptidase, partial [Pseudobdellovibrionaceae bacterium]|nr:M28 family peptidase [Pseudobdellovibrionaceae bacterium]
MKTQNSSKNKFTGFLFLTGFFTPIYAGALENPKTAILADLNMLEELHVPVLKKSKDLNLAYAEISESQQRVLEYKAHSFRKCGGYENLGTVTPNSINSYDSNNSYTPFSIENFFETIQAQNYKNSLYATLPYRAITLDPQPSIQNGISELNEQNLLNNVQWLSAFPDRYNRSTDPNRHVVELKKQLELMLSPTNLKYDISLIVHQSTNQKTIRVQIPGTLRPDEIVVLGGHLDSINQWRSGKAPGADDNASGSSNLIEALRVLSHYPQPERTVEFFWYAGEESGLLGSAEIAREYKNQNKNVIAVLQLDMTLFPGAGEFAIGNVEDYTSSWLRSYLVEINTTYKLGARFIA